jgi:regulator of sirC expression with transglutaminase-like and TPR domain
MANSLFNHLNGGGNNQQDISKQYEEFKKNFQGNPQAEVQRLLSSGKMTQEQFSRLQAMAKQMGLS